MFNLLNTEEELKLVFIMCFSEENRLGTTFSSSLLYAVESKKIEKINSRIGLIISIGSVLGSFLGFHGYFYQINGWIMCTMKE